MKTFKLPKEFLDKWIEALESGDYEQGKDALYNNKGYCCLGVACKIVDISDYKLRDKTLPFEVSESGNIPEELLEHNPGRKFTLSQVLAVLNDGVYFENMSSIKATFPNIKYNIEITKEHTNQNKLEYSFKDIAEFLKLNVEPYE